MHLKIMTNLGQLEKKCEHGKYLFIIGMFNPYGLKSPVFSFLNLLFKVHSMHLGRKIFDTRKALLSTFGVETNGKIFRRMQIFMLLVTATRWKGI